MSWKKAVFFGGAVLLLAACGDATAPAPSELRKLNGAPVGVRGQWSTSSSDSTEFPQLPVPAAGATTECVGSVVHTGLDGQLIVTCVPGIVW